MKNRMNIQVRKCYRFFAAGGRCGDKGFNWYNREDNFWMGGWAEYIVSPKSREAYYQNAWWLNE